MTQQRSFVHWWRAAAAVTRLPAVLLLTLVAGCATQLPSSPGIAISRSRLARARYVEIIYTGRQLSSLDYRDHLFHAHTLARRPPCQPAAPREGFRPPLAAWVWRSDLLLRHPRMATSFLRRAAAHRIRSLYVQIGPNLGSFREFLRLATDLDIRIYALSGSPGDVDNPAVPLGAMGRVIAYNRQHTARFAGIQFDVEPYLLSRYRTDRRRVLTRYVRLLHALRRRSAGKIAYGMVVPFWFNQETVGGRNLMGIVARNADSLAIMSYRTNRDRLLAVSAGALCYAHRYGKPALLGIELRHIPDEIHYFLAARQVSRHLQESGGRFYLNKDPRSFSHYARHYVVPGSEISFYPHVHTALRYTQLPIPYPAFSGWIIDGLGQFWIR